MEAGALSSFFLLPAAAPSASCLYMIDIRPHISLSPFCDAARLCALGRVAPCAPRPPGHGWRPCHGPRPRAPVRRGRPPSPVAQFAIIINFFFLTPSATDPIREKRDVRTCGYARRVDHSHAHAAQTSETTGTGHRPISANAEPRARGVPVRVPASRKQRRRPGACRGGPGGRALRRASSAKSKRADGARGRARGILALSSDISSLT